MPSLRFFLRRIRALWRREELFEDMAQEMRFHVEERIAENVRRGMTRAEAEHEAESRFGRTTRLSEQGYAIRGPGFVEVLLQDARYGLRMLRRSPGFTLIAIFCLSLAIGSNAAVISWIEGILLRPYPMVAHQDRMMAVAGTRAGVPGAVGDTYGLSWPDFVDLAKSCSLIDAWIVDRITGTTLSIGDHAERATGAIVSSNYFNALGLRPSMGRAFAPDEDSGRNAHPVTVISYDLWQRRYRGDQQIIGKTQLLNGQPHTIIGVGPKGFSGTFVGWATDFWVPVSMQERFDPPAYKLEDRRERWIEGYVLLKAGVTPQQAQQEISAAAQRLAEAFPATNRGRGVKLFPLWQTPFNGAGEMLPTLGIALAVVFFVLLVACANVSNLMLLRGLARRHEMTVRVAIGASRGRLVRQLLTEGAALSLIASVIGLLLARWLRDGLVLLLPARGGLKMHFPGEIDWRVLGVSIGICALATLLFALVPSINATRIDVAATLKTEAAMTMSGKRSGSMRSALVVVQIAFSFALLVGTGLLITSLRRMHTETPGFSEDDVVITAIDFSSAGYDLQRTRDFQQQLIDRVEALPGVRSAAFARVPPFSYRSYSLAPVTTATSTQPVTELPTVEYDEVGPGYLRTLGIARVSGREFTRADDENAPPVAIVNDTLAAQLWPGQDAVGQKFSAGGKWRTVVGVARTTRYRSLTETPQRFFYVPLRQGPVAPVLHVRTILPPSQIAGALAQAIHALDANIAPQEIITMREQVDRTIAPQRMALKMISGFAALALVLTAVGLYGVMSYAVAQSTREFGVRIAVGAARGDLVRMVLMRGIRFSIAGVVFGATIALACSRLLGYLLYKVSPRDPAIFALALVLITIAAVAASVVPAWRASQIDVLTALRA